jgi:hypothetical protein
MTISSRDTTPRLVFSAVAEQPDEVATDPLRLRPLPGMRQRYFVFVQNPAPQPAGVQVEVVAGEKVVANSGDAALTVPAGDRQLVKSFGTPTLKDGDRLPELTGPLRLRLRDFATKRLLGEQLVRLEIATPRDFLRVTRAQFVPEKPDKPNRLTVAVRALPEMTGRDAQVELVLPDDKRLFPALRAQPKEGKLTGLVGPGKPLELFAEKIALEPGNDAECDFYLNVDGVKRALWFRSRFPELGTEPRMSELQAPKVRFGAKAVLEPGKPALLRVAFEADNAPAGARLVFHVGRAEGGPFEDHIAPWRGTATKQRIGFVAKGEGGALLIEASLEDQSADLPIPGIVGTWALRAELFDATGKKLLDQYDREIFLDDTPPRDLELVVEDQIDKAKEAFTVRLNVKPPPSKIKEVSFFLGSKGDLAKAEAARLFPGKARGPDGSVWEATLKIPKDAANSLLVSARAKSGLDLTETTEAEFKMVAEPVVVANPKDAASKLGAIEGTVIEGKLPQKGVEVALYDLMPQANQNPLKQTVKTDEKGAFLFSDLEPKRYRLYCKAASLRVGDQEVMVEGGKKVRVELELLYR